ncbi:MAG TPA: hypothetical protein VK186_25225 [Candidatus Deferrimicrobium sp.]|nr:hypothetical protein [Candidatus Kapabacteria bacterium]HLP62168.1 hypothetical protein [Candidatus Deferrimicrobium sp.]
MQLIVDVSTDDIIRSIKKMDSNDLERVKNALIARTIYFKKFKKDKLEHVIKDFKDEGYSNDFLKDLESGLKKSSIYNENKTSKR